MVLHDNEAVSAIGEPERAALQMQLISKGKKAMKSDVSRRNFVALAGASVAVAACTKGSKPDHGGPHNDDPNMTGIPGNYGDDPHTPKTEPFAVDYIGVIDIRARGGWMLAVNHAAFQVNKSDDDQKRLQKAIAIVNAKGSSGRFEDLTGGLAPYPRPNKRPGGPDVLDGDNFDEYLGFKSRNELFIYIDGSGIDLTDGRLLSFTRLSPDGKPRDPNYSFYGASKVDAKVLADGKLVGQMIRVRNYMTDKDGKPIGDKEATKSQLYSIDIYLSVPGEGKLSIPIIIDPTTGNGSGNEP